MAYYLVTLYDHDGYELAHSDQEGLPRARICAMDYLTDREYTNEANYVEVVNDDGQIVFDANATQVQS